MLETRKRGLTLKCHQHNLVTNITVLMQALNFNGSTKSFGKNVMKILDTFFGDVILYHLYLRWKSKHEKVKYYFVEIYLEKNVQANGKRTQRKTSDASADGPPKVRSGPR